ncbi:MAG TPA: hypothetical protein EYG89_01390 [Bacteroidia bacterium]|nr:hypothetical protein [Bacteroidia bacterium]
MIYEDVAVEDNYVVGKNNTDLRPGKYTLVVLKNVNECSNGLEFADINIKEFPLFSKLKKKYEVMFA